MKGFEGEILVKLSLLGLFTVVGIPLNLAQFATIYRKGHLCNSNDIFLASLSLADVSHLLQKIIFSLLYSLDAVHPNKTRYAVSLAVFLTVSHLICMTLERLIAVKRPFWYRSNVTRGRAVQTCIAIWVIGLFSTVAIFLLDVYIDRVILLRTTTLVTMCFIFASGFTFIIAYLYIIHTILSRKKKRKSFHLTSVSSQDSSSSKQSLKKHERKTVIMCLSYTGLFLIFNFPYAITYVLNIKERIWFMVLQLANCLVNSTVYFWLNYGQNRESERTENETRSTQIEMQSQLRSGHLIK